MLRSEVNQRLLDFFDKPSYLEIGVDQGATFSAVNAHLKVGVDPYFKFDIHAARSDPKNSNCEYHAMESDLYFSQILNPNQRFDVIFIDGLHTFDQSLRDLLNSICCIREGGFIVVDDVVPSSYAASIPDLELARQFWAAEPAEGNGNWMGDVYRLAFFIHHHLPLFQYATVMENHGQMVLWRGRRSPSDLCAKSLDDISKLQYIDSVLNKSVFNVKNMDDIIKEISSREF